MGADVLATQGARASEIMMFTMLNRVNSVPARKELKGYDMSLFEIPSQASMHTEHTRQQVWGTAANTNQYGHTQGSKQKH